MPSDPANMRKLPPAVRTRTRKDTQSIVILVYPGVTLLDVAGPAQVFAALECEFPNTLPAVKMIYVSREGGLISTDVGLSVDSIPFSMMSAEVPDTIVVPGGPGVWSLEDDPVILQWIREHASAARRVASVCLGAFLLGWAGLLNGRRVVTHWRYCDRLSKCFPTINVETDAIFKKDGKVWTSAGVSAGIDLALAMIKEDFGHNVAMGIARRLVVFLKRPGGQNQFSTLLKAQASDIDGRFSELHGWIANNLAMDLRVEILATQVGMSPRSFARAYTARMETTPAVGIEIVRIEAAQQLLEGTKTGVAEIARRVGFGDDETMRRAFIRRLGVSPTEYRGRFSLV